MHNLISVTIFIVIMHDKLEMIVLQLFSGQTHTKETDFSDRG